MKEDDLAYWESVGEAILFLQINALKVAMMPEIAAAVALIDPIQKQSLSLLVKIDPSTHGYTVAKDAAKEVAIDDAMPVLTRIQAYAKGHNDPVLLNRFNYSHSTLTLMIQASLPAVLDDILAYGNENSVALALLGMTPAHLDTFETSLGDFKDKLPGGALYLDDKKGTRLVLRNNKATVRNAFKHTIDPQMEVIRTTDEETYVAYRAARKIKNTPTRHRQSNGSEEEKETLGGFSLTVISRRTGDPLMRAHVQVEGENSLLETDEEGQAGRDDLAAGVITLLVTMAGYVDVIRTNVVIVAGEITEVEVEMDEEVAA
jgi:hypothetical protein